MAIKRRMRKCVYPHCNTRYTESEFVALGTVRPPGTNVDLPKCRGCGSIAFMDDGEEPEVVEIHSPT